MFIFGALADAVPALRKERAEFKPDERFLHVVNMIRTGQFGWADCESLLPGLGMRMSSPCPLARMVVIQCVALFWLHAMWMCAVLASMRYVPTAM